MICICCGLVTCAISEVRSSAARVNTAVKNEIVEMKINETRLHEVQELNLHACFFFIICSIGFRYRLLKIFLLVGLKQTPALVVCFKN